MVALPRFCQGSKLLGKQADRWVLNPPMDHTATLFSAAIGAWVTEFELGNVGESYLGNQSGEVPGPSGFDQIGEPEKAFGFPKYQQGGLQEVGEPDLEEGVTGGGTGFFASHKADLNTRYIAEVG
jgi:hypothetical protein